MIGKDVAPVGGDVGDVKVPLLVGDVAADAAVAVDAGADVE